MCFQTLYSPSFSSSKGVKPPFRSRRKYIKPESSYIHTKNLPLGEVLTLQWSSQTQEIQKPEKYLYQPPARENDISLDFYNFYSFRYQQPPSLSLKRLESHSSINNCQGIGTQSQSQQWQDSRSYSAITVFSFFTNISNIPDVTSLPNKFSAMDYSVWRGHCCRAGIKDSTSAVYSICKHTCKIMVCMISSGKQCQRPDIQPKTLQ